MLAASGAWLSPVERTVRVREVPSSNLGAPTPSSHRPIWAVLFSRRPSHDRLHSARFLPCLFGCGSRHRAAAFSLRGAASAVDFANLGCQDP